MHIVVLAKPVPDTTGQERLGPDDRLDRAAGATVVNANDEYALEAALRLVERSPGGGDVTVLTMAPPAAADTLRKALAMGATRAVHVTDPVLAGSCIRSTVVVLAAALRTIPFDLIIAGADTSDGGAGVVAAGVATRLRLPFLSSAAGLDVEGRTVTVRRISTTGYDVIEAQLPAVVVATQALGEPRYPSLKGIMGARSKEIVQRSVADIGLDPAVVGGTVATTTVVASRTPPPRAATRVVRAPAEVAAREVVDFLVERRVI